MSKLAAYIEDKSNGPTAIGGDISFATVPQNRLVIDGGNLALWLANSTREVHPPREVGGSYTKTYEMVVCFFEALTGRCGVRPVVVFDGVKNITERTHHQRVKHSQGIRLYQDGKGQRFKWLPAPLMISEVFLDALHDDRVQDIDIHFVGENADPEIVAIANSLGCPVLSSSPEFYMCKITGGFIPLTNFQLPDEGELLSPFVKVFHVDRFVQHFKLKDEDLRFFLPAILGNDYIDALDSAELQASGNKNLVAQVIRYACRFASFSECLVKEASNSARVRNLEKTRMQYKSVPSLSFPHNPDLAVTGIFSELLPHYQDPFRKGCFQTFMVASLVCGKCVFRQVFEDVTLPSVHTSSLPIRVAIYQILGCTSPVREFRRAKDCRPEWVSVTFGGFPPVPSSEMPKKSQEEQKSTLLSILHCDHSLNADLPSEWHLPVVATRFWYTQSLLKSFTKALVATFVACHGQSSVIDVQSPDFRRPITGSQELEFAHHFTQWQWVYFDTVALNQVLLEPCQYIRPARLFDGVVAAYFTNKSKERELSSEGFDVDLYSTTSFYQLFFRLSLMVRSLPQRLLQIWRIYL